MAAQLVEVEDGAVGEAGEGGAQAFQSLGQWVAQVRALAQRLAEQPLLAAELAAHQPARPGQAPGGVVAAPVLADAPGAVTKHGVSLALAADLEWDTALIWPDERWDYGESRERALALLGARLYFVAFVDRANVRRIISLRKATNQEHLRYVRNIFNDQ